MDLEGLSVDELKKIASGDHPAVSGVTPTAGPGLRMEDLSIEDLQKLAGGAHLDNPGILENIAGKLAGGVAWAGKKYDSYVTSPLRAAVGAYQDDQNPLSAYANQFGAPPEQVPSGHDIMVKAGVSDEPMFHTTLKNIQNTSSRSPLFQAMKMATKLLPEGAQTADIAPSPADVSGFGTEVVLDPTNLIPLGLAAKGAGKGIAAGARGVTKLAGMAALKTGEAIEPALRATQIGNMAVDTAKTAKRAMDDFFHPKQLENFSDMVSLAERNGIDPSLLPESVEFGHGSSISRIARSVRENPLVGEPEMQRFNNGLLQVDAAVDNKIAHLGGGPPLNEVEAGQLLRDGHDKAVDDLFSKVDFTYNSVIDQAPGITLTPKSVENVNKKLGEISRFAEIEAVHGVAKEERTQAKNLLEDIHAIRGRMSAIDPQAGTFGSMKQIYEVMSRVGRQAFKKGGRVGEIPVNQEKFRDLYFTLRDEFVNSTAEQLGPDVANALIDSNQQITMFNKNIEPVSKLLNDKGLAPEKLFRNLIVNGDTTKLGALKEMLTPEQFNRLRASYVEGLVTRNTDGTINFGALRTKLQKNTSTLSVLFRPEELGDVIELTKLGEKWGPAVLSTSGTGASNVVSNAIEGLKSGATNKATLAHMKESARKAAGTAQLVEAGAPSVSRSPILRYQSRSSPEEALKAAQIFGTQQVSQQRNDQSATMRRLEAIKQTQGR